MQQIKTSDYQEEPSSFRDLGPEFMANQAVTSEQISEIKALLLRYDERMTRIETELRATEHIKNNQRQLEQHHERMNGIETDLKAVVKDLRIWVGLTATISAGISAAILAIAKFLSP